MKIKNNKLNIKVLTAAIILLIVSGLIYFVFSKGSTNKLQVKPKGLLSLNTDQAQYTLGEKVHVQIVSLDNLGNTLCDSNLKLSITQIDSNNPAEQPVVTNSPSCDPNNSISLNPDYFAYFTPPSEGEYQIKASDLDNNDTSEIQITVGTGLPDFSITRWGATRIDPIKTDRSPMKLTLTSNKDFSGILVEQIPQEFEVIWQGPAKVENTSEGQTISWEVELKKGESEEFVYEYQIPAENSKQYVIGTANLASDGKIVYEENYPWQIISINSENKE